DGDTSLDKQDDLAGFNCVAVNSFCTWGVPPLLPTNWGDTTADDNCPAVYNPLQDNWDSQPDWTNTPNTPAGEIYRGDATNNHQDWQGDACDTDGDNDGLDDVVETAGFLIQTSSPAAGETWCRPKGHTAHPTMTIFTSPYDSDTDDDGGLDGRECQFGSKPNDATSRFPTAAAIGATDSDSDLLFPDLAETFYRTRSIVVPGGALQSDLEQSGSYGSPIPDLRVDGVGAYDPDSDGDYLNDGVEVKWYATDPSNFDTDTDGCSDGREAADVNGDHRVNSTDSLGIAQHQPTGILHPAPTPYFTPGTGIRRTEFAGYDINKDGNINSTDMLLAAKLTGNCAAGTGAQINSRPIIELTK
ncbi:MAG: hypothetical protein HY874_00535, partial [Chloroflexi bacterium]|nr:hypothetical protein [Chloroflexota bacterium]